MDLSDQKERFSLGYVHAVAAVAGFDMTEPRVDKDSIDVTLSSHTGVRPRLDLQVKCTARIQVPKGDKFPFRLSAKNYNELRLDNVITPRLLVTVLVPPDLESWLSQSRSEMTLRHCGYWLSLASMPLRNESQITVQMPTENVLTPVALRKLMDTLGKGGSS